MEQFAWVLAGAVLMVGATIAAITYRRKGPAAMYAQAARDFSEARRMISDCLAEDFRITDERIDFASRESRSASPHSVELALQHRTRAAEFAERARVADGHSYWKLVASTTGALAEASCQLSDDRSASAEHRTGQRMPPCLFDPAHGPAVTLTAMWAPEGGRLRPVPACVDDAELLLNGLAPPVRQVESFDGVVNYFDAGGIYVEWLLGYYGGFDPYMTARLLAGTRIGAALPGRIPGVYKVPLARELRSEFGLHKD